MELNGAAPKRGVAFREVFDRCNVHDIEKTDGVVELSTAHKD